MAQYGINELYGAWREEITASTLRFSQQVSANRCRNGLNVRSQLRLIKKGANKKVLLGDSYNPKFVYPRGKAWLRVAMLAGL